MPSLRTFRARLPFYKKHARWSALAVAVALIWACNSHQLVAPTGMPAEVRSKVIAEAVNRNLDIVFMVDDSPSMDVLQDKLADQFPAFMQVLEGLSSGLPNVHIAVVTQDLGAGGVNLSTAGCPIRGDQGQFRFTVGPNGKIKSPNGGLEPCTTTGLTQGQTFISDVAGAHDTRVKNYSGAISDVFGCIAGTGDKGCGFEAQLASVARALGADGQGPPPETNTGFLRPDAFLAIVLITNEDDGSAPPNSGVYATNDPAPFDNFRGQEYGTLCDGAPPPLTTAMSWPPGHCVSNPSGGLTPVQGLIDQIKSVKADPRQILVAALAAAPDPYGTHIESSKTPSGTTIQTAFVNHSCTAADGSYGDPGVRLSEFVSGFGGIYRSICADSFAPALQQIAMAIGKQLGAPCIQGPFEDKDLNTPGVQQDCDVTDQSGAGVGTVIPSCDDPHQGPCWSLVADPANCPGNDQLILKFTPPPDPSTSSLNVSIACSICPPGAADPRCR